MTLIFMDTETTGLEHDADVWEFAAIKRTDGGAETELHLFIDHDADKCAQLPEPFQADHILRYPAHGRGAVSPAVAAHRIYEFFSLPDVTRKPHVVGCVPNFDTEKIASMLRATGRKIPWHHHLIDVENLAVGWLYRESQGEPMRGNLRIDLPWNSDELSRVIGVEPPTDERHTAMGDARWAMAMYDKVTGYRPSEGE